MKACIPNDDDNYMANSSLFKLCDVTEAMPVLGLK